MFSRLAAQGILPDMAAVELRSLVIELQQRRNQDSHLSAEEAVLTVNSAMMDISKKGAPLTGAYPLCTHRDDAGVICFEDGTTVAFFEDLESDGSEGNGRWYISCLDPVTNQKQILAQFEGRVISGFISAREAVTFAAGFVVGRRNNPENPSDNPT